MSEAPPPPDRGPSGEVRWQSYLRNAREPLFLLNRRRRLLFANHAWEACTGWSLAALRGRSCRPSRGRAENAEEAVVAALAPPHEALAGETCRARRRAPAPSAGWWQLDFFPLLGEAGLLGILGKITVLPSMPPVMAALPERLMALRDRQAAAYRLDALSSAPPALRRVAEQARLASQGRMPVTLVGEAGTGKHWLARAIHQGGAARERSFAVLDCRTLPALLLDDLLLEPRGGRMAFGTVYLPEPAELPRELQERLAHVLIQGDEASDRPRIIVGHCTDPAEIVRAGRLIEELHCAASTLTIPLPPLRERLADLDALVTSFLIRVRLLVDHKVGGVSPEAAVALRSHGWPGNLAELFEVLRGACARAKSERIELADLPFFLRNAPLPPERTLPLDQLLEQAERRLIGLALRRARGNRARAAELLGIWRPRLVRRMEHFGIEAGGADDAQEGSPP
jgi:transcriptional regulator with PAS, ATPase and Fis domain